VICVFSPSCSDAARVNGRLGALVRLSLVDDLAEMTAPARSAFLDGFYQATDSTLPPSVRARKAKAALRAHMARLSKRGVAARARQRAARRGAATRAANADLAAPRA
jgi:hypothetical protein